MSPANAYRQRLDRGWLLMELKNWSLAEREFREAVSLEPQAATPRAALAWCIAQRSVRQALDEAREAVRLEPTLDYAHYTLGHLLIDARDYTAAGEAVDEALRLDPRDVNHHALRARLRIAQNHWREALKAADEGLAFSPQDRYCLRWRAIALREMGMPILAEKTTAELLASHPEDAAGHEQHAWALLQQGEAEPAEMHFRESLRLLPHSTQAKRGLHEARRSKWGIFRFVRGYARNPELNLILRAYLSILRDCGTLVLVILGMILGFLWASSR